MHRIKRNKVVPLPLIRCRWCNRFGGWFSSRLVLNRIAKPAAYETEWINPSRNGILIAQIKICRESMKPGNTDHYTHDLLVASDTKSLWRYITLNATPLVPGDYLNFERQFQACFFFSHIQIRILNSVIFLSQPAPSARWRLAISLQGCQTASSRFLAMWHWALIHFLRHWSRSYGSWWRNFKSCWLHYHTFNFNSRTLNGSTNFFSVSILNSTF